MLWDYTLEEIWEEDSRVASSSREIISQLRHVESEKPRNIEPCEQEELFFFTRRDNSRR